jgi:hypothetical protein
MNHNLIPQPYKDAFDTLAASAKVDADALFRVVRKLRYMQGPPLRGYLDSLVAQTIPNLPRCANLPITRLQHIRDVLIDLIETASGIPPGGFDGVLAYLVSNGKPEVSLRGKCVTLDVANLNVEQAAQPSFRYVACGTSGLPLGKVEGQRDILHRKMQNAYLNGNFESVWMRAMAAEKRLLEMALTDADQFDVLANQLEGTVLAACQDAEALQSTEDVERKRGVAIYREILQRLDYLATKEPSKVESQPIEMLVGVAGMLSGSCRFAWGVPLEEKKDGA